MAKKRESGSQSGGVNISGGKGRIDIGGDVVGRDKITTTTNTSGMTAEDFTKAFSAIYDKIAKLPTESQPVVKSAVDTIKAAA
ncbi:MAG TPA: hypothetical protein VFF59_04120, partial [Anaerolineae bacterium]|nr:hypothetical protein [Anaerolineae bacterium]